MSFNNDQNEPGISSFNNTNRETSNLLPRYYRTKDNKKFLQGTLDQLTQPGTVKKVTGYLGRESAKATTSSDIFLSASDKARQDYQLEPAAVIKDYLGNTTFFKDYIDYINYIDVNDGNTVNHSRLNKQEFYSWNPHINWDKFVNFQQYYWLPFGPDPIEVSGQQLSVISEYTVKGIDEGDNVAYLFTPNGLTRNPTLTLFREQTYVFDINAPGHPFSIKTERVEGSLFRYNTGVDIQAVENGKVTFKVPKTAPDVLFYVSENSVDTGGSFQILDIEENTFLDLDRDILGKKTYVIPNGTGEGIPLSNGMKLFFEGKVSPEKYSTGFWYVEGVGESIKLLSERSLEIRSSYIEEQTLSFDDLPFDQLPFSETGTLPLRPDYITINRASLDNNPWSRYNRWFHRSVIETSTLANGRQPELDQTSRATRPIIEFNPDIKLYNYGISTKEMVDVIDNYTTDVFSTIEGSTGYSVDGISLAEGMRVLFTADTDILVKNRIFKVNFINVWISGKQIEFDPNIALNLSNSHVSFTVKHGLSTGNQITYLQNPYSSIPGLVNREVYTVEVIDSFTIKLYADKARTKPVEIFNTATGLHKFEFFQGFKRQIHLTEEIDSEPKLYETVAIRFGVNDAVSTGIKGNQGQNYWYDGVTWNLCQIKTGPNTSPLFDVFDNYGVSFSDKASYDGTNFTGTKIFSYKEGYGTKDINLGFPLSYKNINNVGDIVFNFNLLSDSFNYKVADSLVTTSTNIGYLKVSSSLDSYRLVNGWEISNIKNSQPIVRTFKNSELVNNFPIDVFDNKIDLEDLSLSIQIKFDQASDFVELTDDPSKFVVFSRNKKTYLKIVDSRVTDQCLAKIVYSSPRDSTVYEKEILGSELTADIELTNYIPKLDVRVYVNGKRLDKNSYIVQDGIVKKFVVLDTPISTLDILTLRIFSKKEKNNNGYYEIPINLQNNPLNDNVLEFTLGQVVDHVDSIIDNINDFKGTFPGENNLRDLGNLTPYGTRFVQHSGSLNTPLYHFGSKSSNILKALDQAKNDYGRFKRAFLIAAENTGLELDAKRHVDYILQELAKNKPKTTAYYLSDMFAYTAAIRSEIDVLDSRTKIYPLSAPFSLTQCSNKAVNIYVNGVQALYGKDYTFSGTDFFSFTASFKLVEGDLIEIYEYESTDGCYCPPTPTKLGLYPKFEPKKYLDDSYQDPTEVIQGHDGSITVAYGDYRDDLILELERRIFNNIKVSYDPEIFNLYNYIPGYSRETDYTIDEFNEILSKYFYQWTQNIPQDYTKNINYSLDNPFTWNFKGNYTVDNVKVPGGWRGIYRWFFDTDVPNLKPWESLGFSIRPEWWESTYGPAPYTSDNYVLWEDLRDGRIKEPGKPVRLEKKFSRTILKYGVPVDEFGKLVPPTLTGFISGFINQSDENFVFGDEYIVESAWRRSSYYAFSIIQSLVLMHPADVLGRCIDRSRIVKNSAGQLIYSATGLRTRLADLIIPSMVSSGEVSSRNTTAGLINYIADYLTFERTDRLAQYSTDLKSLTNNISTRLGGFTSKDKYKLLLDSKSPNSSGGVFVPAENYFIDLNVSSSVKKATYSGVIVTKYSDGYEIRGYNFDNPYFNFYDYKTSQRTIQVGGISESFSVWNSGKQYVAGKIVQVGSTYYRANVNHVSGNEFDASLYSKLSGLPIIGGITATLRSNWDKKSIKKIAYGTKLSSVQEVVDVMQGYGEYLEDQGFVFDDFNNEVKTISNWETSIKEFLFWVSQGWAEGSVLSLSPAANRLTFRNTSAVVDSLVDPFYGYGIYRVDGQKLDPDFIDVYRGNSECIVEPRNTEYGIYGASLYLVQKEHIVVFDDSTLFNDTIYDKPAGYRQEKIKAIGYVTTNWNGGFDIPGFIYDRAVINSWEPWTDYHLGDIVKYKEFYYSAKKFLVGTSDFDSDNWVLLEKTPTSELLPNWDYRAAQFTDFYDLDTDNFDSEQQRIAQHLTGYQKRQYLENIINNDVSQYKFYQGMITEKGTQNVLTKLFDVLSADNQESLTFDEEWAFRVGEYGSLDTFDEVEFILDESKFKIEPQPLTVTTNSTLTTDVVDYIYKQKMSDLYVKPRVFSNELWKTKKLPNYLRTPGYVRRENVKVSLDTLSELVNLDIGNFVDGDYIWTAFEGLRWNVYRFTELDARITNIVISGSQVTVEFSKVISFAVGDIIGINFSPVANEEKLKTYPLKGFHSVTKVSQNTVTFTKSGVTLTAFNDGDYILAYSVNVHRMPTINDANSYIPTTIKPKELLWVDDNGSDKWGVYEYNTVYQQGTVNKLDIKTNLNFGKTIAVDNTGNVAAVADNDIITIYTKPSTSNNWNSVDRIEIPAGTNFGKSLHFSSDNNYLFVGYPDIKGIAVYKKTPAHTYELDINLVVPTSSPIQEYEYEVSSGFNGATHLVGFSQGQFVHLYSLMNGVWVFKESVTVKDSNDIRPVAFAIDNNLSVISSRIGTDVTVRLYGGSTLSILNPDSSSTGFGTSLSVSSSGTYIAVSSPDKNTVYIYKHDGTAYKTTPNQTITSRTKETSKEFGKHVEFINDDQTLIISSINRNIIHVQNFTDGTTFDGKTLRIVDLAADTGRVDVYDRYDTNFIYGETLFSTEEISSGNTTKIAANKNTILISSLNQDSEFVNQGVVLSYIKPANSFSWKLLHEQNFRVDVSTIKKAFLYNRVSKQIVKYLDVVDPTQGKIPGIADQEIKFKGYYDPAIYSNGNDDVTVDVGMAWTNAQVGMIWWDLTNARFLDTESGDVTYRSSVWNKLYDTASIDVYEWVESPVPPEVWDARVNTEAGITAGFNGKTKYGSNNYSVKRKYDNVSQSFVSTYYFWVKDKITIPNVEGRTLSAKNISQLIADPAGYGYSCLAFIGSDSVSLVNVEKYTESADIVLSVQYWISDYRDNNYHSQWKLLSTNRNTYIPSILENKWFHSLLGKDNNDRPIPDISLPEKLRYGIEYKPRQSMFVNRVEALKQYIERVNSVLKNVLVTDNYDISSLMLSDSAPSLISGKWDFKIDTEKELRFVNTTQLSAPTLTVNTDQGKVTGINIVNSGRGFGKSRPATDNTWYSADIVITGQGTGAIVKSIVNEFGEIVSYEILEPGENYDSYTYATVRDFTVLVDVDTNLGTWAMYSLDINTKKWYLSKVQSYNVQQYWSYIDWYADGYDQFVKVDRLLQNTHELVTTDLSIGDVVKVANIGSGGWVLLEKYNSLDTIDYTENFKVVGREKGTIQFLDSIYSPTKGYDRELLDSVRYDNYNVENLRIILNTVRDTLLVDDLKVEYLRLFFSSVRYAMYEQTFIDWAFKTSFVKAQHNVGTLRQKVTYNSDNLEFFEEYINEVKPYRTKVREYLSTYSSLEPSRSSVTDFDLLPVINNELKVNPLALMVNSQTGEITTQYEELNSYPWKHWQDSVGFEIIDIKIVDQGSGYTQAPIIKIEGVQFAGGNAAKAKAYISSGKVNRIELLSSGLGRWVKAPAVIIEGGVSLDNPENRPARAVAIIGNSVVRSNHIKIKFDRTSKLYQMTTLDVTEQFVGSGSRVQFPLTWSPDIEITQHRVIVNNAETLKNEYTLRTVESTTSGYTRYSGLLSFNTPPAANSVIIVHYKKNFDHLSAVDRINFFYDPKSGQTGKDLGQLMTGVDYGGVAITGLDLGVNYGWDSLPWFTEAWDVEEVEFEDYTVVVSNTPVYQYLLPFVPMENEEINVYVSRYDESTLSYSKYIRIDDVDFKTINQTNKDAVMTTFVGDGEIDFINLPDTTSNPPFELFEKDRLIFRRATSDGSKDVRPDDYDTKLTGGDFAYTTAVGINADDIVLDGDSLVSSMTSHAPEEVVPGQIMDALAIKVYSRPSGGCPNILFKTYVTDGITTSYNIGQHAPTDASVIVKLGDMLLVEGEDYTIDYPANTVNLTVVAQSGQNLSIISISAAGSYILDLDYFVADGETVEYITKASWTNNFNITVLVNGSVLDYTVFSTDEAYTQTLEPWRSRIGIRFAAAPKDGAIINYIIDDSGINRTASIVKSETLRYNLSQDTYILTNQVGKTVPFEPGILVNVNGKILSSPSYSYFEIERGKRVYSLDDSRYDTAGLLLSDLQVYLDNALLTIGKDYSVVFNQSSAIYSAVPGTLTVINKGVGYTTDDVLIATGGDSTGDYLKIAVTAVNSLGEILSTNISSVGSYTAPPSKNLTLAGGHVSKVTVVSGGSGYVTPVIQFSPPDVPGGEVAKGTATVVNGVITKIEVTYPGYGYTSVPGISIKETTSATPTLATATATISVGVGAELTVEFDVSRDMDKSNIVLARKYTGPKYVGKTLVVGASTYADYRIGSNNDLILLKQFNDGDTITVTSFYNHEVLEIQRGVDNLGQLVKCAQGTPNYYKFTGKLGGIYTLDATVLSGDYAWVIRNGDLLVHRLDYFLENDRRTIRLVEYLNETDVIQIIAFTNVVVQDSFGFMQFKDMMNRTHYKRLNRQKSTRLSQDLKQFDKELVVANGEALDNPNPHLNIPGIVEINGERIEYFAKTGNVLSRLTRATLGTGAPTIHKAGTVVQGLGSSETIPYKDEFFTETFVSSGTPTNIIEITDAIQHNTDYPDDLVEVPSPYYAITLPFKAEMYPILTALEPKEFVKLVPADIEVFVGGYRLKKESYVQYTQDNNYPYSPVTPMSNKDNVDQIGTTKDGDIKLPPEFVIENITGTSSQLKLTNVPSAGTKIVVVRKHGKLWNDIENNNGLRLVDSTNPIAKFITAAEPVWPEANYKI